MVADMVATGALDHDQAVQLIPFPGYPRGITVLAIVDVPTGAVVTNDFPQHGRAAAR
jgi:hypothetical protein